MANFGTATFTAVLNNAPLIAGAAEARGALGSISKGLGRVGAAITASVTVPTVLAGGAAVQEAVKIQDAWNEVRKVYNGSAASINRMIKPTGLLGKAVSDLSLKYGIARDKVIGVLGDIAAMGYTGKQATRLLQTGIEYAVASGIELEDGLKAAVTLMSTFQLRGKALNKALAGLNLTENETAARGIDLSVGLSRAGGAAEALQGPGFKAADAVGAIAAGMAVFKTRGQETYRSADALRAIFQRLYQAPTKSKELGKLFDKLGVKVSDAKGQLKPFPKLIEDLAKNFDKLTPIEQQAFTSKSIGIEFGPLFSQMIKDVKKGVDSGNRSNSVYLKTLDQFGNTAKGQAAKQRELKIAQDSLSASIGRVKASWGLLVDTLTPIVAKYLKPITKWIGDAIKKFADMDQAQQENILKWIGIGAAIGPVLLLLSTIGGAVATAIGALGSLGGIWGSLKLFKEGSEFSGRLGPFIWNAFKTAFMWAFRGLGGILLTLLGPLGTAIGVFFSSLGSSAIFGPLIGAIGSILGPIGAVVAAINPVVLIIGLLVGVLMALWAPGNDAGDMFAKLKEIFANVVQGAKDLWKAIQPILGFLREKIAPLFRDAFIDIFKAIGKLLPILKPIGILLGGVIVASIIVLGLAFRAFAAIVLWVANLLSPIIKFIVSIFQWLFDVLVGHSIIPDLIKAFITWFKMIASVIVPIVKTAINMIVTIFKWMWQGIKVVWGLIKSYLIPVAKLVFKGVMIYLKVLFAFWKTAFKVMWTVVKIAWGIISVVFKAIVWYIKNVLGPIYKWLWEKVVKPIWNKLANGIKWTWEHVLKPVFVALKNFLHDTLVPAFRNAVDAIKKAWDRIKAVAARPVNFVIDTVYNNGLRKAFNWVAEKVGSDFRLPHVSPVAFAKGGVVPGSPRSYDTVNATLRPGEGVLVPQATKALGGKKGIGLLNKAATLGKNVLGMTPIGMAAKWAGKAQSAVSGVVARIRGMASGGFSGLVKSSAFKMASNVTRWIEAQAAKTGKAVAKTGLSLSPLGAAAKLAGIFDQGGMLPHGMAGVNTSGRPEAVFSGPQWNRILPAMDAISSVNWQAGGLFDPATFSGGRGDVNVVVNNPVPEPASRSVGSALKTKVYEAGWR